MALSCRPAREGLMFLRNGWYAACWSKDLGTRPVARTFLGEKVVLFRGARRRRGGARGPLLPPRGAAVARRSRGRYAALRLSRAALRRRGRCVEVPIQTAHSARRAGPRLSRAREMERGVDLDGRSGARRRRALIPICPGSTARTGRRRRAICSSRRTRSSWSTICSISPTSPISTAPPSPATHARRRRR